MTHLVLKDAVVVRDGVALLQDANLDIRPGQLTGLVGPNGAGKTTAVRALLGLQQLARGKASIGGRCVTKLAAKDQALMVAYLPQARQLAWPVNVYEVVALGRFAYGSGLGRLGQQDKTAINDALAHCDLLHLAERSVANLSGGELARVHVARAFATCAPAIVADEPTAALDPKHAFGVLELLRAKAKQGDAVLVILHDLALAAQFCDKLIVMQEGRVVVQGPPRDALSCEIIAKVFGVSAIWQEDRLSLIGNL